MNYPYRRIDRVIRGIIGIMPNEPPYHKELKERLLALAIKSMVEPPETQTVNWDNLSRTLEEYLGNTPVFEWHWEILSMVTDISTQELKQYMVLDREFKY